MSTQLFKAKDVKSAINLVNQKFGEKAIILSTKQNNGVVEIEASDNDEVIKTHKKQNYCSRRYFKRKFKISRSYKISRFCWYFIF